MIPQATSKVAANSSSQRSRSSAVGTVETQWGVLVQTAKGLGDNGIGRIAKLNGILYLPVVGSKTDIILLCLRWYFRFKLSYRDLVAILGERGLSISHTTILRWVIRYAETCEKRWGPIRAAGWWELVS